MITQADVRRIALSMPEAEEKAHVGRPDFRVKNKIFATIWPSGSRAVVKLSVADQSALVAMDPEAFSVNSWSLNRLGARDCSATRRRLLPDFHSPFSPGIVRKWLCCH